MARARLDGVPPDVCIVGQKEQPGATLSPGATAAAAAAKALQALAGSVAEKNKRLSRQLVSMDCAAASGALCCNDPREVVARACSVEVAPCYPCTVSTECAAAPGALCFNDVCEVVAWAYSVRRT